MGKVEIRKVDTVRQLRDFVQFYYDLYRDCPHAVPFLYSDEFSTLRKDKNPAFEFCDADYFVAYKDGKMVGRVAAILNKHANQHWNVKQVRFGYFDFIDDFEVSSALMDTVEKWGKARGMNQIAGPLGFTDTCSSRVSTGSPPCISTTTTPITPGTSSVWAGSSRTTTMWSSW